MTPLITRARALEKKAELDWEYGRRAYPKEAVELVPQLCDALELAIEALEDTMYNFNRIETANWGAEQKELCAEASKGRIQMALQKLRGEG